jgi:hypothetical protein
VEHPHIAVIHEIGEDAGVHFIAMELVRSEKLCDLRAREQDGDLDRAQVQEALQKSR